MRRKMKRGDHLEGEGILLLTLVSQLNPLDGAINILVMMSDESPRAEEADQRRRTYCFWIMLGRKGEKERVKKEKRER